MLGLLRTVSIALLSIPGLPDSWRAPPFPARLVYEFPLGTFIENIACRPNGHLLLSVLSKPHLYTLDPTAKNPTPELVYEFPNVTGMTGIAETNTPDVFAIVAGNWTLATLSGHLGTFSVWSVDFRKAKPVVTMIAPIPDTDNLNGLAVIEGGRNIILLADSSLGAVWSLDPSTGKSQIAIRHPDFAPGSKFPLGINGINTIGRTLYFANSGQNRYGRMQIRSDGTSPGQTKTLATLDELGAYDDFALDKSGNAYIATHPGSIHMVTPSGQQSVHCNDEILEGPTSSIFGRGSAKEASTLYVTTGGRSDSFNVPVIGGQVIAIDGTKSSMQGSEFTDARSALLLQGLAVEEGRLYRDSEPVLWHQVDRMRGAVEEEEPPYVDAEPVLWNKIDGKLGPAKKRVRYGDYLD